jgi:hypothetical protein
MIAVSHRNWTARLVLGLGLAFTAAACAPQGAAPQASAPTSTELPVQPAGRSTTPPSAATQRPDSASMQGMSHSGMQGHNMSGMSMQDMMAHCRQMQADARRGGTTSPDMQAMMAHCNQMQSQGGTSSGGAHRH